MKEYKVISTDTKHFKLTNLENEIGNLEYVNWFSFKSKLKLIEDSTNYEIEPKGFWGTTIELKKEETILLNFKMHWNGNIIINTHFNGHEIDFVFKQKGLLKNSYILLDKNEQELLVIQPDFKWGKLSYDYSITASENFEKFDFKNIMLILVIHCANYYMTMTTMVVV